jgi:hypothetical protein
VPPRRAPHARGDREGHDTGPSLAWEVHLTVIIIIIIIIITMHEGVVKATAQVRRWLWSSPCCHHHVDLFRLSSSSFSVSMTIATIRTLLLIAFVHIIRPGPLCGPCRRCHHPSHPGLTPADVTDPKASRTSGSSTEASRRRAQSIEASRTRGGSGRERPAARRHPTHPRLTPPDVTIRPQAPEFVFRNLPEARVDFYDRPEPLAFR